LTQPPAGGPDQAPLVLGSWRLLVDFFVGWDRLAEASLLERRCVTEFGE
jgi:hypothetical protein